MRELISAANLSEKIVCSSAGTYGGHAGESPDRRMIAAAKSRGIALNSRARKFEAADFGKFHHILAMDNQNLSDLLQIGKGRDLRNGVLSASAKDDDHWCHRFSITGKLTDFCISRKESEVPDPYYGSLQGFEDVLDILDDACRGLLAHWQLQLSLFE